MIDYRPYIKKTNREITNAHIINQEQDIQYTLYKDDIESIYSSISSNSIFETIDRIFNVNINTSDVDISNNYIKDVMSLETHISRINNLQIEADKIRKDICDMLYGTEIPTDDINITNANILNNLTSGYCDNDVLYYLSKIIYITNRYLDYIDNHIKGLLYSEIEIKRYLEEDSFIEHNYSSINNLLLDVTIDLEDQVNLCNYLSDKNLFISCMNKLYNLMIDYVEVKNSDISTKAMLLDSINDNIDKSFTDAVKTIEYIKTQSSILIELINSKYNSIKNIFK